jgi:hypothetical protein
VSGRDATERARVRRALAAVLARAFDTGRARGTKTELGRLLSTGASSVGSNRVSRILAGKPFPDRDLAVIAEFTGYTLGGLLRAVALECDMLALHDPPQTTRKP